VLFDRKVAIWMAQTRKMSWCILADDMEVSQYQAKGGTRSNLLLHALKCGGDEHEGKASYLGAKGNMALRMAKEQVPSGSCGFWTTQGWRWEKISTLGLKGIQISMGLGLGWGFDLGCPVGA